MNINYPTVTAFIQARTGSTRLPGKVLMPLAGKPVISHCIEALMSSLQVHSIVLCTSTLSQDDSLEKIANDYSIGCFRGSENDVLERFYKANQIYKSTHVVRITADDPLLDPSVIDEVVTQHLLSGCDYTSNILNRSWPRGLDTEIFTSQLLNYSHLNGHRPEDREHVTIFARTHPDLFTLNNVQSNIAFCHPELRLCIDTIEDYRLLTSIFDSLYDGKPLLIHDVVSFLLSNRHLLALNSDIQQKQTLGKVF